MVNLVSEQETRQLHRRELLILGAAIVTLGLFFVTGLLSLA